MAKFTRRIHLSELVADGLLHPGEVLLWRRPRLDELHRAFLLKDGRLALADGTCHDSPSSAASHIAGRPVAGWGAWETADGIPIDTFRYRYMRAA
ncbi:hypothetical protein [Streptomyces sp. NPDC002054]|uniref:restriction system modified-DNA reader domain-containing protein n=1 Tax=Streptomyces sp. NPDC002054 TaxID=3154663 RepID=UPI00331B95CE